jgi:hypothetical protein
MKDMNSANCYNEQCGINPINTAKELHMTNLTITLPDDLAEIAQAQGLLSTKALKAYIRGNVKMFSDGKVEYPTDFDFRFKGIVNPALLSKGKILGDIVSPIDDVEWEAMT